MSLTTQFQANDMPTHTRIKDIHIFNGASNADGSLKQDPYVEILLVRCWPVLDSSGNHVLNQYGQPTYKDSILEVKYIVSDMAELITHLATMWEPLMTAAESTVDDAIVSGKLVLPVPGIEL